MGRGGKCAEGTADVKDGQLHAMFKSMPSSTLGADFRNIGDGD